MKIRVLLFILLPLNCLAQEPAELTPEERAYLFHIVKKSPILDTNMGRYFDYRGPIIKWPNKTINYDSIEQLMMVKPELLVIRREEINKVEKGVVGEASNKMALWELNRVLAAKREGGEGFEPFKEKYEAFEKILIKYLPPNAMTHKNGQYVPNKKLDNLTNPALSVDDKLAFLGSFQFMDQNDRFVTMKAINQSISEYVQGRALEIFRSLGGEAEVFNNVLIAAGDGSASGSVEGREKDEKGIWNVGLPKAVGLFPYQIAIKQSDDGKSRKIEPAIFPEINFVTVGKNKHTNVHFDVWGYNSEKQTTVVIEKHGLTYHLFSNGENRFLSPDSSFVNTFTFKTMMNDLEFNRIARLYDMIHGRRGFDYWIAYNEKKKDQTELKIEKHEKKYSDFGYTPIVTAKKMSRKTKKEKKKAGPNHGKDWQPTTESNKGERKDEQNTIVGLYHLFDGYKLEIAKLKKEKAQAIDLMAKYSRRLDYYNQLIGIRWAKYTVKDNLYTFEDSTTFDWMTQEFQFQAKEESEDFEVRLLMVPESCLSDLGEEVMMHISVIDATPNYDARLRLELTDEFASDSYTLARPLFTDNDSVAMRQFFESLLNKKMPFTITARGEGIGMWNDARTVKNTQPKEELSYKGTSMDSVYLRLRKSELFVCLDRVILVEVNSYTDPVASSLKIEKPALLSLMSKHKLSKNDILSAYRTATILKKLKDEVNTNANKFLDKPSAKEVTDRFNKEYSKVKIKVGKTTVKLSDL
jgi:hypothetical protein